MALKQVRLELARTKDYPNGSANHGYQFVAPLDEEGHFDAAEWKQYHQACTVHRFWVGEPDEHGTLVHRRDGQWAFSYEIGDDDDEPIFKFDRHSFVEGEYVSVTEHDGETRPFKIVWVRTPPAWTSKG